MACVLLWLTIWWFSSVRASEDQCRQLKDLVQEVPLSSLTASSMYNNQHGPTRAKLNTPQDPSTGGQQGGWVAHDEDTNKWIQVDLLDNKTITGVQTQGRAVVDQYTTSYKISHSINGLKWNTYVGEEGKEVVFQGNIGPGPATVTHLLTPMVARYVRIHPLTWVNFAALRFGILTCVPGSSLNFILHGSPSAFDTPVNKAFQPPETIHQMKYLQFDFDPPSNHCLHISEFKSPMGLMMLFPSVISKAQSNDSAILTLTGKGLHCRRQETLVALATERASVALPDFEGSYKKCVFQSKSAKNTMTTCKFLCPCHPHCLLADVLLRFKREVDKSEKLICNINLI